MVAVGILEAAAVHHSAHILLGAGILDPARRAGLVDGCIDVGDAVGGQAEQHLARLVRVGDRLVGEA